MIIKLAQAGPEKGRRPVIYQPGPKAQVTGKKDLKGLKARNIHIFGKNVSRLQRSDHSVSSTQPFGLGWYVVAPSALFNCA
ncbi:MAG TPA: hypothetical protein VF865_12440 [Acidobacteriaceae bacterium]